MANKKLMRSKECSDFKPFNNDDINKIVGIMIDGAIYSGITAIRRYQEAKRYQTIISLAHANFMSSADCGIKWNKLSGAPVLFKLGEYMKPLFDEETAIQELDGKIVYFSDRAVIPISDFIRNGKAVPQMGE